MKIYALVMAIIIILGATIFSPIDNSDRGRFNRSGFKVHTDALTGVQYVSTFLGGIHPRIDRYGKIITVDGK